MIRIAELREVPHFVPTIVSWIRSEWPDALKDESYVERRLCGDRDPGKLPAALVAILHDEPIGFVSLIYHEASVKHGRLYWIDALYVVPEQRGRGLALELLKAAESKANDFGIGQLFALTEIPGLYIKAGWSIAEIVKNTSPGDYIMQKVLDERTWDSTGGAMLDPR